MEKEELRFILLTILAWLPDVLCQLHRLTVLERPKKPTKRYNRMQLLDEQFKAMQ
jgi:hypothetical protein